ncbi:MAG: class II aldolase/adducin family protein [Eggerthellaceae bacterium]|nr:class II aldolase/adducin family protein [Eggerthellaceae bacterium]
MAPPCSPSPFADLAFVRGFVRMCDDGWRQGWHERNGGNASYRMTAADVAESRPLMSEADAWTPLDVRAPQLAGAHFLVTVTGSFMRYAAEEPARTCGIVEIDNVGAAYRRVCGFDGDGRPTSEFSGHMLIHAAYAAGEGEQGSDGERGDAALFTDPASRAASPSSLVTPPPRVVYHAHPVPVIALSKLLSPDAAAWSRALWRAMTECVMVFPEGVGVVGFEVPGSMELARASAEQAACGKRAVVWAHHGLLCAGTSFDDAFGRMHAIVKAADIHNTALAVNGVSSSFASNVTDGELRAIAKSLGLALNESYLA